MLIICYIHVPSMSGLSDAVASESRRFSGKISGHWILAPGLPVSRTPVATPMGHKARCPVEEWHVPSSLASESDQA